MLHSLKKFFKSKMVATNYDTYNNEVAGLTAPNLHSGIRYEISRAIFPFLQLSSVGSYDKKQKSHQYFATVSSNRSIFQFSTDNSRNYQFKSSFVIGPLVNKVHSIISSKKEVFNQIESIYNSKFYNIGLKLISPAYEASNLIYVINYWRSLGHLCFGAEAVGFKNELGISFSTRYENEDSVYCFNLQRFNLITVSFYKKIMKKLEIGAEVKKSQEYFSTAAGVRLRNFKNDIKCTIDQRLNMNTSWNEKLSENISIDFTCGYDFEDFDYGIGISYES